MIRFTYFVNEPYLNFIDCKINQKILLIWFCFITNNNKLVIHKSIQIIYGLRVYINYSN